MTAVSPSVNNIGDLLSGLKSWFESFLDTLSVLFHALDLIHPDQWTEFEIWMPSLIFDVMCLAVILIVVLRIIGR